ncbi:hypothetical protein H9Q72_001553 [Fusarium xylarioides]|uniref:Uncharacterized protein n=1 Tax=Fusarium xylarioides TaxID=221167 RepID=A0A9P7IAC2_9HYPO|nr:hypothetical protein H9Q72_001553 [Fusarium xylarioides]
MLELTHRLGFRGMDNTLDSFINPVLFFQAAVLSLRNTLIGQPSSTLGEVVALFCLSHVVSCQLRNNQNPAAGDTQLWFDQWGNTISKYDHRQAFFKLVRALFPELANPSPASNSFDPATTDYSNLLDFINRNGSFEQRPIQDGNLAGYPLEYHDATRNMFSLPLFRHADDAPPNGFCAFGGEIPLETPQTSAPFGPHGSALVTNLTLFLDQCGDLFQMLSGLWVTAKHQYSPLSALNRTRPQNNDVCLYLQRMRQDDSFQDPFSLGILSIVDTFIQLGYLQTPEDVQEYMIMVGKEVIPDREFVKFCPLVVNTLGVALHSGPRGPSTPFTAGPERYVK